MPKRSSRDENQIAANVVARVTSEGKNPAAVSLGGLGGLKGGRARAARLSESRRRQYRRALAEGEEYAKRLLSRRFGDGAPEIAEKLVWDYPAHDFVIDYEEAKKIALPVQRLPIAQEKALITALSGLMEYEAAYVGFATKRAPRRGKATKTKAPRKLPTPIAASARSSAS